MKFTRVLTAALCAVLLFPLSLRAQMGETAYSFLNIPTSSHAFALGGCGLAIVDPDVTLVDQNPALLGPEIDMQASFNYMHYLGASNFAGLRFGMAAGERGAWSAGIRYLNYGSITQTDPDGTVGGTFSPQDVVIEGSYAHDFTDRLRGGISMKMIYSGYEQYSAFAMAVDLGLNYFNEEKDLSFSVTLTNMGGQLKRFHEAYDRLPFDIRLGYMQRLGSSPFSLAITAWNLTKWKLPYFVHKSEGGVETIEEKDNFGSNLFRHLVFGLQYAPTDRFYIGLGYNYKTRTDMASFRTNFLSGFSVGAGLRVKSFGVGVSYAMPHKSGSELMLNLSMDIGELLY